MKNVEKQRIFCLQCLQLFPHCFHKLSAAKGSSDQRKGLIRLKLEAYLFSLSPAYICIGLCKQTDLSVYPTISGFKKKEKAD